MENNAFIQCWNEILTPKWIRFRHLLSGNGQTYSKAAAELFDRAWYGNRPTGPEEAERFRELARRVEEQAR